MNAEATTKTTKFNGPIVESIANVSVSLVELNILAEASELGLRVGDEPWYVELNIEGEELLFVHEETKVDDETGLTEWVLKGEHFTLNVLND